MEKILKEMIDRIVGYLVAPLAIIFAARVDAHQAFMAALRSGMRQGRVVAWNARLEITKLLAKPTVAMLGASAGALVVVTGLGLLVRHDSAAMIWFAATMLGMALVKGIFTIWQRLAIPVLARDARGRIRRRPTHRIVNGKAQPNPRAGEPIYARTFRPGRWSPTWTAILITGSWAIAGTFFLILSGLEESSLFGAMAAMCWLVAAGTARVYWGVFAKILQTVVGATEGGLTFIQDQLAVIAPGITWSNLRQRLLPVDLVNQQGIAQGGTSLIVYLLAYGLLIDLISLLIGPNWQGLVAGLSMVGLIQVGMLIAVLLKAEQRVKWLRERFADKLAILIGPIVVVLGIWKHFVPTEVKEHVGWWGEMLGRFGTGTVGIQASGPWNNIGLIVIGGVAALILIVGSIVVTHHHGTVSPWIAWFCVLSGIGFLVMAVFGAARLSANVAEDKVIDLPQRKFAPAAPRGVQAYQDGTAVIVSWTHTEGGVAWYDVERRTARSSFVKIGTATAGTADYRDATAAPGTDYYYRVVAVVDSYYRTPSLDEARIVTAVAPPATTTTATASATASVGSQDPKDEPPPERTASAATDEEDEIGGLVPGLEALITK
ncbi:MAG: hypothetical protein RL141_631 [Candidatus Parcubacteria bacterium]|jgi:hypothetical protein